MKNCPICKARCFDDMKTCFGCMYRFDGDAPSPVIEPEPEPSPLSICVPAVQKPAMSNESIMQAVLPVNSDLLRTEYKLIISLQPREAERAEPIFVPQ